MKRIQMMCTARTRNSRFQQLEDFFCLWFFIYTRANKNLEILFDNLAGKAKVELSLYPSLQDLMGRTFAEEGGDEDVGVQDYLHFFRSFRYR